LVEALADESRRRAYGQSVTVNAAPSKYGRYFRNGVPRSVGDALIEEFRNKVIVPQSVIKAGRVILILSACLR
jgi:hypothetical protein